MTRQVSILKVAVVRSSPAGRPLRPALMPAAFALLGRQTPPEVELAYYDEWLDPLPALFEEDAVAIMADTPAVDQACRLADRCRQQGRTVLLWGQYPTALPDAAKRYADAVICGVPGENWRQAMADLAAGRLQLFYGAAEGFRPTLSDYDYDLFALGLYPAGAMVEEGLDAAPPQAVAEMPQQHIIFTAPGLLEDEAAAEAWLDGMAPLRKRWVCRVGAQEAQNPRLLQRMRGAGCHIVVLDGAAMGFAAGGDAGAGAIADADLLICGPDEMVRNIHAAGLMVYARFVFEEAGTGAEDVARALGFARKQRLAGASFVPRQADGTGGNPALVESCEKAQAKYLHAAGRCWRGLACRANRQQLGAYIALGRYLIMSSNNKILTYR